MGGPGTEYERRYWEQRQLVAGIDEAGRGALAGPVVAAAVVLQPDDYIDGVRDSKQLRPAQREQLFAQITQQVRAWAIGWADVEEINRWNILQATMVAMRRAIEQLTIQPDVLFVDGNYFVTDLQIPAVTIPQGDQRSLSIAAASILAKVWRDRWMTEIADPQFPEYGFARHKGYGTRQHRDAIQQFGVTPLHRKKFVQRILEQCRESLF